MWDHALSMNFRALVSLTSGNPIHIYKPILYTFATYPVNSEIGSRLNMDRKDNNSSIWIKLGFDPWRQYDHVMTDICSTLWKLVNFEAFGVQGRLFIRDSYIYERTRYGDSPPLFALFSFMGRKERHQPSQPPLAEIIEVSGTEPGVLDSSQRDRILRSPQSQLLFASFDPYIAIPRELVDLAKLNLQDEGCRPKRIVIEVVPNRGTFWRWIPSARKQADVENEGEFPRIVLICGYEQILLPPPPQTHAAST